VRRKVVRIRLLYVPSADDFLAAPGWEDLSGKNEAD
jgi:hypothetical protein